MKNKYYFLWFFIILSLNLSAQTYLSPILGFNNNCYKFIDSGINGNIVDLKGRNNYSIGIELDHFVLNNFNIRIGGTYYLLKESYKLETIGIIPYYISNYRNWSYYFKAGYNVFNWVNLGIGYKKLIFHQYESITIGGVKKVSIYNNYDNLLFHISFYYKNLNLNFNYSKSLNNVPNIIFDNYNMIELNVGYKFKIIGHKK